MLRWLLGTRLGVTVVAAALVTALLAGFGVPRQAGAVTSPTLGLFVSSQSPSDVESLASQLKVTAQAMDVYADGSGYNTYPSPPSTSLQLVLAVGNVSAAQATAIGDTLVADGHANTDLRIMWELNGNWFAWGQQALSAAQQISDYCTAEQAFAAVAGNHFTFTWNINAGSANSGRTQFDAWPGGSCRVDHLGIDQYDGYDTDSDVLADISFAQSKDVPVEIDEWGLNGTDDPAYINWMSSVVHNSAYDVVMQNYFSYDGSINSDITQFPQSEAAYSADFGGTSGSSSPTSSSSTSSTSTSSTTSSTSSTTSSTTSTTKAPVTPTTTTPRCRYRCGRNGGTRSAGTVSSSRQGR